jgi:hypothetical protein
MHDRPLYGGERCGHGEEEGLAVQVGVKDGQGEALVLGGAAEDLDRAVALGPHPWVGRSEKVRGEKYEKRWSTQILVSR